MDNIQFIAIEAEDGTRDGENGWKCYLNGVYIDEYDNDELNMGSRSLDVLWKKLQIEVKFDYD